MCACEQMDFCDGGSLAVPDGNAVIPIVNELRKRLQWDVIILTQVRMCMRGSVKSLSW